MTQKTEKCVKIRKTKAKPSEMADIAMAAKKAADEKKAIKAAKALQAQFEAQIKANKGTAKTTPQTNVKAEKTAKNGLKSKGRGKRGKNVKNRTPYQLKKLAEMAADRELNAKKYGQERKDLANEREAHDAKLKADRAKRIEATPQNYNTTKQARAYFSTPEKCYAALEEAHKINGVLHCAYCKHDKVYRNKARQNFKCAKCRRQFSVTTNTFLSKSKLDILDVFEIMLSDIVNTTNTKIVELRENYGFTHKTAVNLLYKIRSTAFNQDLFTIEQGSTVAIDTTAIIGSDVNRHDQNKLGKKKTYALSKQALTMKQEFGVTKIEMIPNLTTDSKRKGILPNVPKDCLIVTDEHRGFWFLKNAGYKHEKVNHALGENARGRISSNGAESVHASLKTALKAHFNSINKKYLQQFINATVFYKNSKRLMLTYEERFMLALTGVATTKKPLKIKLSEQRLIIMTSDKAIILSMHTNKNTKAA